MAIIVAALRDILRWVWSAPTEEEAKLHGVRVLPTRVFADHVGSESTDTMKNTSVGENVKI